MRRGELITEVPALTPAQARRAAEQVKRLRRRWITRHPKLPFYTLGASSWRDLIQGSHERYCAQAERHNPVLGENFDWLYATLLKRLESHLGAPAAYGSWAALPPFQIYRGCPEFERELCGVHIDAHFVKFKFPPGERIDPKRFFSFTLAIELPPVGGGMDFWRHEVRRFDRLPRIRQQFVLATEREYKPYAPGRLYLHWGYVLHRPSARAPFKRGQIRIIMQGHGLWAGDHWWIYG